MDLKKVLRKINTYRDNLCHRAVPISLWFMKITILAPRCRRVGAVNCIKRAVLLEEIEHWSLTTLREKLIKIGAKVVSHGRYVTFQLAEVAVPRSLFRNILSLIDDLRRRLVLAAASSAANRLISFET